MAKKIKSALAKATTSPIPVKVVSNTSDRPISVEDNARERKWKAEDALRICKEYEKIKGDKQLIGDVKKLAKEEMKKLGKVAGKY